MTFSCSDCSPRTNRPVDPPIQRGAKARNNSKKAKSKEEAAWIPGRDSTFSCSFDSYGSCFDQQISLGTGGIKSIALEFPKSDTKFFAHEEVTLLDSKIHLKYSVFKRPSFSTRIPPPNEAVPTVTLQFFRSGLQSHTGFSRFSIYNQHQFSTGKIAKTLNQWKETEPGTYKASVPVSPDDILETYIDGNTASGLPRVQTQIVSSDSSVDDIVTKYYLKYYFNAQYYFHIHLFSHDGLIKGFSIFFTERTLSPNSLDCPLEFNNSNNNNRGPPAQPQDLHQQKKPEDSTPVPDKQEKQEPKEPSSELIIELTQALNEITKLAKDNKKQLSLIKSGNNGGTRPKNYPMFSGTPYFIRTSKGQPGIAKIINNGLVVFRQDGIIIHHGSYRGLIDDSFFEPGKLFEYSGPGFKFYSATIIPPEEQVIIKSEHYSSTPQRDDAFMVPGWDTTWVDVKGLCRWIHSPFSDFKNQKNEDLHSLLECPEPAPSSSELLKTLVAYDDACKNQQLTNYLYYVLHGSQLLFSRSAKITLTSGDRSKPCKTGEAPIPIASA